MNRSAVTTLLAAAAIMVAAPAASADISLTLPGTTSPTKPKNDDPMQTVAPGSSGSSSSDVNTGTSGGLATTGSTGNGSFGLPNLDKIILGPFKSLCAVTGSAFTALGQTSFGCDSLTKKPGDGF